MTAPGGQRNWSSSGPASGRKNKEKEMTERKEPGLQVGATARRGKKTKGVEEMQDQQGVRVRECLELL